jgi:hypothetical protein
MLTRYFFITTLLLSLLACGFSTEKRRPQAIEDTLDERSIKKISEAEIINRVNTLGDSISSEAQELFMSKISEQYEKNGFEAAAKYCSMEAYPLTDSLAKQYKVFLSRVSLKNRSPRNEAKGLEKELLEAYAYSKKEGIKLNTNVQFIHTGDTILYNKPIFIASNVCLNCHGSKENISPEIQEILNNRYPNDKATGYQIGDLRGMWSLKFLKKEIVQGL